MRLPIAVLLLLLFAGSAVGQITYSPVALVFPQIVVGGDAEGQNYVTLIQLANNNSAATTGHLALFSDSGSPLPALFDGAGPQSTMDFTLAPGVTRQIQLTLNGSTTPAWMQIAYTPSDAVTTVILQFRSGSTLLSEVGIDPAFDVISATDLASETDSTVNTGVAVSNPSPSPAYVLATLWNPATGDPFGSTTISLPPNGHIARFVTELFPSVPGISQTRAKVSLDSCSSSACNFAGGIGFVATAIRLNGDQFTTIPIEERPTGGNQTRIMPQVAFGGPSDRLNMKTVLYFTTNVSTGVLGTADIFDNDGNPLAVSADGGAPSSSITFTVPGNRVSRVVLSGDDTLRSGWIRLTLPGEAPLLVNAVFQTFNGPNLASEASVLESAPINRGLIYVKIQSGAANAGIAFANGQSNSNTITLDLFNQEGFLAASREVTLPPNGHLAQFVTELFPQLAPLNDFQGALSMHSFAAFSALALRLTADKTATLPVAPDGMYRPSITGLRITRTQRSPAQVSFDVDVADFNSDVAISSATSVMGTALIDFGSNGYDYGPVSIDGNAMLNRSSGTLSSTFQPPHVTGAIPGGVSGVFYLFIYDSLGNESNVVGIPVRF